MRPRIHRQLLPLFNAYSKKANDVQMYKANVLKIFMATQDANAQTQHQTDELVDPEFKFKYFCFQF